MVTKNSRRGRTCGRKRFIVVDVLGLVLALLTSASVGSEPVLYCSSRLYANGSRG
jgi:hypothetical protein